MKTEDPQKEFPANSKPVQSKQPWQTPDLQEAEYEITGGPRTGFMDGSSGHGS